jgi:hypothetical protein
MHFLTKSYLVHQPTPDDCILWILVEYSSRNTLEYEYPREW